MICGGEVSTAFSCIWWWSRAQQSYGLRLVLGSIVEKVKAGGSQELFDGYKPLWPPGRYPQRTSCK